jgi:protein transport protein SEC23
MDYESIEANDAVRFSWNVWPPSKQDAAKLVIPVACLYTPLKEFEDKPALGYEPVVCKCRAILNPYCQIDVHAKFWVCPFCLTRNAFPPHYKDISMDNLPAELLADYTTVEYTLNRPLTISPIFFFVVDTCTSQSEEDLIALKEALIISLGLLPQDSLVGLITFGTMVQIHEIGFTEIPKAYIFRGSKEYTSLQLQELLGLGPAPASTGGRPVAHQAASRFVLPVKLAEFGLSSIFEQLQKDPWPVDSDKRPQRATGAAISNAVALLETLFPGTGARILLFCGGPCTIGAGQVVSTELREAIRSHHDISEGNAKYIGKASKFYDGVAKRAAATGHTIDILVGCLDQVGLAEMRPLVNLTGGNIVLSESFSTNIFKQSCQRIFLTDSSGNLRMGFNGTFEVILSKELKVSGVIGPVVSLDRKNPALVADTDIGVGNTCAWKMCQINPRTTLGVFFEMQTAGSGKGMVQFHTLYQHPSRQTRLRVTTICRAIASDVLSQEVQLSFDQEAAAALIARIAVHKAENGEDGTEIVRWLDRLLIRLCQKFGSFSKDDPHSFTLQPLFSIYPQFMFHLRRSQFLQVFNNSPDETAYFRHALQREKCSNALVMIQPTLVSYRMDGPPQPVLLDSVSIRPDVVLLLDAFFHIVIFHGEHVAHWRNEGFAEKAEYSALKKILTAPFEDAKVKQEFHSNIYRSC